MKRRWSVLIFILTMLSVSTVCAEELHIGDNSARTNCSAYMNVRIAPDSNGKAMLLFRAKDIPLLGYEVSYYEVGFDTGRKISLRKFYTGYYTTYTVTLDSVKVDNNGGENRITADVFDNTFRIYLNNKLIIDYTDNGTYNEAVYLIPTYLTGDIGYHIDGNAEIVDYGSTDAEAEESTHIASVEITDSSGEVIEDGSYVLPGSELNYEITYTERYDGASVVSVQDAMGRTADTSVKNISDIVRNGTFLTPNTKEYFNLTEFAWNSMGGMQPQYPKAVVAEFNKKNNPDYYNRKEIREKEQYTYLNNRFVTSGTSESADFLFGTGSSLQDVFGIALCSNHNSTLYGENCYRAVIRDKNTVSLEKVWDGTVTVLAEAPIDRVLDNTVHNIRLYIYGPYIAIYYDGEEIIRYLVPDIFCLDGRAAVYQYGKKISFENFVLND